MRFTKMHGLGNDFIVIEAVEKEYFPTPNDARRLCNRRTGIGADGLLLALPSQKADLRMRLLNSDGSTAEMCGNGIRCFAKFAYERGLAGSNPMRMGASTVAPNMAITCCTPMAAVCGHDRRSSGATTAPPWGCTSRQRGK